MATGGYSRKEAHRIIEKRQRDASGPSFLIGYSRLGNPQLIGKISGDIG